MLARRRDTSLYRTIRANQAGVVGPDISQSSWMRPHRTVLGHAGMTAFDLMHIMAQGEDVVLHTVDFGGDFWANVELLKATGQRGAGVRLPPEQLQPGLSEVCAQRIPDAGALGGDAQGAGFGMMARSQPRLLEKRR